jgi:hypothetical protein
MEASRRQFACANPEKSKKTKEKIQNILDEEENKLEFDKPKSNKAPSFLVRMVSIVSPLLGSFLTYSFYLITVRFISLFSRQILIFVLILI